MGLPFSFNGWQFDALTAGASGYNNISWDVQLDHDIHTEKAPLSDIALEQDMGRKPTIVKLQLDVLGSSVANFRANLHTLYDNCYGVIGKLYRNSDKYWWARLTKPPHYQYLAKFMGQRTIVDLEFQCADPFLYYDSGAVTTIFGPGPNTFTAFSQTQIVANPGSMTAGRALTGGPQWTLTGPLTGPITLTNSTLGQSWTYTGNVAPGHTVVIDTGALQVLQDGVEVYTGFTGDSSSFGFVQLAPGNNTLAFACAIGQNTGKMTLTFTPRDHGVD